MKYLVIYCGVSTALFTSKKLSLAFAHKFCRGCLDYYIIIDIVNNSVIESYCYDTRKSC